MATGRFDKLNAQADKLAEKRGLAPSQDGSTPRRKRVLRRTPSPPPFRVPPTSCCWISSGSCSTTWPIPCARAS